MLGEEEQQIMRLTSIQTPTQKLYAQQIGYPQRGKQVPEPICTGGTIGPTYNEHTHVRMPYGKMDCGGGRSMAAGVGPVPSQRVVHLQEGH